MAFTSFSFIITQKNTQKKKKKKKLHTKEEKKKAKHLGEVQTSHYWRHQYMDCFQDKQTFFCSYRLLLQPKTYIYTISHWVPKNMNKNVIIFVFLNTMKTRSCVCSYIIFFKTKKRKRWKRKQNKTKQNKRSGWNTKTKRTAVFGKNHGTSNPKPRTTQKICI